MRLLRTSSCSRRTHLAPLAVVVAHPKHLGKPAFRAVFHHRREALDRQVAEYFVHPAVMVEVSVRDDGQPNISARRRNSGRVYKVNMTWKENKIDWRKDWRLFHNVSHLRGNKTSGSSLPPCCRSAPIFK